MLLLLRLHYNGVNAIIILLSKRGAVRCGAVRSGYLLTYNCQNICAAFLRMSAQFIALIYVQLTLCDAVRKR